MRVTPSTAWMREAASRPSCRLRRDAFTLPRDRADARPEENQPSEAGGRVGVCPGLLRRPPSSESHGGAHSSSRLAPLPPTQASQRRTSRLMSAHVPPQDPIGTVAPTRQPNRPRRCEAWLLAGCWQQSDDALWEAAVLGAARSGRTYVDPQPQILDWEVLPTGGIAGLAAGGRWWRCALG